MLLLHLQVQRSLTRLGLGHEIMPRPNDVLIPSERLILNEWKRDSISGTRCQVYAGHIYRILSAVPGHIHLGEVHTRMK